MHEHWYVPFRLWPWIIEYQPREALFEFSFKVQPCKVWIFKTVSVAKRQKLLVKNYLFGLATFFQFKAETGFRLKIHLSSNMSNIAMTRSFYLEYCNLYPNYLIISCIFWELFGLFCKNRQGLPVSAVCFATLAFTVLKVILKVTKKVLKWAGKQLPLLSINA